LSKHLDTNTDPSNISQRIKAFNVYRDKMQTIITKLQGQVKGNHAEQEDSIEPISKVEDRHGGV